MAEFLKSPMNYPGGKYRLLPQIIPHFPGDATHFIDLFCGGLDVTLNASFPRILANDSNENLVNIYREIIRLPADSIFSQIDDYISRFELSKDNKDGYLKFREYYNENPSAIALFTLTRFAYNYQMRFNSKGDFNTPSGAGRSDFTERQRKALEEMVYRIKAREIMFVCHDFRWLNDFMKRLACPKNVFVYADPPYLISDAVYNEQDGWTEGDEKALLSLLDACHKRGMKFALSNVMSHNGRTNDILAEWVAGNDAYNLTDLSFNYKNASYNKKDRTGDTLEVLITNY